MKKWEYMVQQVSGLLCSSNSEHKGKLDEYGKEGWELVSVCCEGQFTFAYFKRPNE